MKEKKSKGKKILDGFIYGLLILLIILGGCLTFHSLYYDFIYVDGDSMYPTLVGDLSKADFGIIDKHKSAINKIERFDIVTTYYPWSGTDYALPYDIGNEPLDTADYKIKRVIALPGETFKISDGELFVMNNNEWENIPLPFERTLSNIYAKDCGPLTLKNNEREKEYWVLGDNWDLSNDCGTRFHPIYKENITGVLVAIEGTCKVTVDASGKEKVSNYRYHWPRFY